MKLAVSIPAIFLVATLVAAFASAAAQEEAVRWVKHTSEVELAISTTRLHLRDVELAQARHGELAGALEALVVDEKVLRQATRDNARQQRRLDAFHEALEESVATARTAPASWTSDSLRSLLTELRTEEETLMSVREESERHAKSLSFFALVASSFFTIAFAIVAIALLRRQHRAMNDLSVSDELTGLRNRRGFMLLAEQHARLAERAGTPFTVIFADLDGLKRINDGLGHEVGDRAIKDTARALRATFRIADIVARLGGDEFAMLVVNENGSAIETILERLRRALAIENEGNAPRYRLSLSSGASTFEPRAPRSVAELLAEADERMYANKAARLRSQAPPGASSRPRLQVVGKSS